jgi:hypothetical protein
MSVAAGKQECWVYSEQARNVVKRFPPREGIRKYGLLAGAGRRFFPRFLAKADKPTGAALSA